MFYRYEHYMSISHMALVVAIKQAGAVEYTLHLSWGVRPHPMNETKQSDGEVPVKLGP